MRSASLDFEPVPKIDISASPQAGPGPSGLAASLTLAGMSLGGGVSKLQWVVSAYTIAFAAFILTAGRRRGNLVGIADRYGRSRRIMNRL